VAAPHGASRSHLGAEGGLSRSLFYRLVKEGRRPRLAKVGRRTLISAEAAAEWRVRMERETSSNR
jgi:predicted DNA-binding transcriptional regulator AlpA